MHTIQIKIDENSNEINVVFNLLSDQSKAMTSSQHSEFLVSIPYLKWSHLFNNKNNNFTYWIEQLKTVTTEENVSKIARKLESINFYELLVKSNITKYKVKNVMQKFNEARYFLSQIQSMLSANNDKYLNYYLSAFVTPARSVLQYIYESARQKKRLGDYNNLIGGNDVLKFFKERRNFNIHRYPIYHNKSVTIDVAASITISAKESINVQVYKDEDGIIYEETVESNEGNNGINNESTVSQTTVKYIFEDSKGDEDLLLLSNKYIESLERIINKAINLGLID